MILALTLAQIACGLLLSTLFLHRSEVGARMLQLLGAIASLMLLPWIFTDLVAVSAGRWLFAAALVTLLWFLLVPRISEVVGMPLRFLAAGLGCAGVVFAVLPYRRALAEGSFQNWFIAADALTSALLLGSTLGAMLLGHGYLVMAGMSLGPLLRLTAVMGFACLFKVLTVAGALLLYGWPASEQAWWFVLFLPPGLFFIIRVLIGVAGPIALTPLVWKTTRIHATQSATGILYASVVLVLIGELTANFLFVLTPFPF